ncbi:MAG: DUF4177 domain-containing protein [Clostridia bacterium]|nr:DUF4177 domain-containing protein [Clostridia bacterium]
MKTYTYVNLKVSGYWTALRSEEHRMVIDEYAKKGFRYVGYIPTHMDTYGKLRSIDLIFEKDENDF